MKPSKISELLEKVNRLAATDNLSLLEIDLLKQHLRDLYDVVSDMSITGDNTSNSKPEVKPAVTVTKRTLNPNQNILLNEEPVVKKEKELLVITPTTAEKEFEATPTIIEPVKQKKEEPVVKAEVKQKETVSKSSINESVESVSSLNEKVKSGSKEVHRKLSTKPLKDLIDLNKKFILLNELFKGNSEAFSAAIRHIDSVADYAAAEAFIKTELHTNYFWDESSQSVRMFMKLVKQKFGEE